MTTVRPSIVIPVTIVAVRDALVADLRYEVSEDLRPHVFALVVKRKNDDSSVRLNLWGSTKGAKTRACWVVAYRGREQLYFGYMLSSESVVTFVHELLSNDEKRIQKALKPYRAKERKRRERQAAEAAARHAREFPTPKPVGDRGEMDSWERMELAVRDHSTWKPPKLRPVRQEDDR